MLQVQGPPALATDANLAKKLKITDDQKVKLAQIGQDYTAKMRELFQSVRDGGGAGGGAPDAAGADKDQFPTTLNLTQIAKINNYLQTIRKRN